MKQSKIFSVNIFTYKGDEDIIFYSAVSALKVLANRCNVYVIDDHNNPISETVKNKLVEAGINYRQSTFNRNNNLNGKECCEGILEEIIKSAENNKNGISIKLDTDTLICRPFLFDFFEANIHFAYMASHRPASIFSGICYCIRNEILDKMQKTLKLLDLDKQRAPEDMVLGCVATLCAFPKDIFVINEWTSNNNYGTFTAYNYDNDNKPEVFEYYQHNFDVITFGNLFQYPHLPKEVRQKCMENTFNFIPGKY